MDTEALFGVCRDRDWQRSGSQWLHLFCILLLYSASTFVSSYWMHQPFSSTSLPSVEQDWTHWLKVKFIADIENLIFLPKYQTPEVSNTIVWFVCQNEDKMQIWLDYHLVKYFTVYEMLILINGVASSMKILKWKWWWWWWWWQCCNVFAHPDIWH